VAGLGEQRSCATSSQCMCRLTGSWAALQVARARHTTLTSEMPNLEDLFSVIFIFWRWLFPLLGGASV
jgi:hypothetical protein